MSYQKQILQGIIDEPTHIKTITPKPTNAFQRALQWLRLRKPQTVDLNIKGATLRTMDKVALIILDLKSKSDLEGDDQLWDLVHSNAHHQALILATAIHNHNSPTPEWLINAMLDDLNGDERAKLVQEVYRRLDIDSFFASMGYLKSLAIANDIQETTASQPSTETLSLATN